MEKKYFPKKQRLVLINRDFQFRYTGAAVLVGLLSTSLTTALILYPLYKFEILRLPVFLPLPIISLMLLAAVLNVLLVGFMGILLTHRIAGPMYSLVRQFRRVEDGRWYGQMRIRDGDDLRYVVRNFNAMLEAINRQTQMDSEKLRQIRDLLIANDLAESEKLSRSLIELKLLDGRIRSRISVEAEHEGDLE